MDTNILIFMISGETENISRDVQNILSDYSNILYTSSLSVIEIIYLQENHKIKTRYKDSESLLKAITDEHYIQILHTKDEHLQTYSRLKPAENHKDQIDHFIISQAVCEKIPLVSSDRKFHSYISQNLDFVYNKR